jgi:hypothetical protein
MKASGADGTRSILDMERIGREPDYGVVVLLPPERLVEWFGTKEPTLEMIESNEDFFEDIERGHGVCVVAYNAGKPSEICFAGYSYD